MGLQDKLDIERQKIRTLVDELCPNYQQRIIYLSEFIKNGNEHKQ